MTRKPKHETSGGGRVSPTAPENKSLSATVWRFLEDQPEFNEAMERGTAQIKAGKSVTFKEWRRAR